MRWVGQPTPGPRVWSVPLRPQTSGVLQPRLVAQIWPSDCLPAKALLLLLLPCRRAFELAHSTAYLFAGTRPRAGAPQTALHCPCTEYADAPLPALGNPWRPYPAAVKCREDAFRWLVKQCIRGCMGAFVCAVVALQWRLRR